MDDETHTHERPAWWDENERLKRELDIPDYEPPRFSDGTYVHDVVDEFESAFGCTVRFVGYDTTYPDDWTVTVDGVDVVDVGRHRDANGNTVYEVDASTFRRWLGEHLESQDESDDES